MLSYTVSFLLATAGLVLATAPPPSPAPVEGPATVLHWERAVDGTVTVSARTQGPELDRAQREVQALADRLDSLRMVRRHVVWRSIHWDDGVIRTEALADTAVYANVALIAGRRLFEGRTSKGSHVQQLHRRPDAEMHWRVRIQLVE